ncbi:MAG: FAD:protein FMN transferase [Pseudomonadota bacterium]
MKITTRMLSLVAAMILIPAIASTAVTTSAAKSKTSATEETSYQHQYSAEAQFNAGALTATIVASSFDEGRAQATLSRALSRAHAFDVEVASIEDRLNSLSKGETIELSPDMFAFISKAKDLAAITHGWFDPTAPSPKNWFIKRDWRRIKLNPESRTLSLNSNGIKFDLGRIATGFITDLMLDEIANEGFTNAMVETGTVHRNSGRDIFTPWNIIIGFGENATSTGTYRAYRYNIKDVAAATVTPTGLGQGLTDAHNKKPVKANGIRSVTVFASDATTATAFALASYTLGPKHGLRYIEAHPETMCIMVDSSGTLIASKNMTIVDSKERADIRQTEATGGPNDLRQKKHEESMEQ